MIERDLGLSLVCRSRAVACALPLDSVIETMRPLPVEPLAAAPPFVSGVAVIRGEPVPVLDVACLLGQEHGSPRRFVSVRTASGTVALSFDEVVGIRVLDRADLSALPPLLDSAAQDVVAAIGTLDAALLVVLRGSRLVPRELMGGGTS